MSNPDQVTYTEKEKALLREAFGASLRDEAPAATPTRAESGADRRRKKSRPVLVASSALLVFLASAVGYWTWSGRNSKEELPFDRAVELLSQESHYTEGNLRAATGRLWNDCKSVVRALRSSGALTADVKLALVASLDSEEPIEAAVPSGFTSLQQRLVGGGALDPEEREQVTEGLRAAVYAVRMFGSRNPQHQIDEQQFRGRLRKLILQTEETESQNESPSPDGAGRDR